MCCSFYTASTDLPCYRGVAVLSEKIVSVKIHQFVSKRYLTRNYEECVLDISTNLVTQEEESKETIEASRLDLSH